MAGSAPMTDGLVAQLKNQLESSEVLTPSSPGYDAAIKRWSDAAVKQAGAVLLAKNAADISQAVRFAGEHKLDLAVRGGGHSVSGTSSSEGGLVIDLSRMKNINVHVSKKTITAQGGALWTDVDTVAAAAGLATVGGTVNHTGIGGLTLGGGYGWLSAKYGLVIDNLLAATVVVADGSIVKASKTENPDLFWAIRGAGHNFGVAVDFTYQAYDQANDVFCGTLVFTPDKLEPVIEALNSHLANPDINSGAVCVFSATPSSPLPMVVAIIYYNGSEADGRARFADLFALEPVLDSARMEPYTAVNAMMNQAAVHGGRRSFKGLFFSPPFRPAFAREVFNAFTEKIKDNPEAAASGLILEYFDMRKVCEVPLTDTAFANRSESRNGVLTMRWEDPEKDMEFRSWARDIQMMFKKEMESQGAEKSGSVPQYINYAEPGDVVVDSIYGVNTERLQHLKWQYDPTNVFGKMNPIKPVQAGPN